MKTKEKKTFVDKAASRKKLAISSAMFASNVALWGVGPILEEELFQITISP